MNLQKKNKKCVKYLGVHLDQNLKYHQQVTTLSFLPAKNRLKPLNASVLSHLHRFSVLINGIQQNLISDFEKQSNWGIKARFIRLKSDSAQNVRIEHGIASVRNFIDSNAISF